MMYGGHAGISLHKIDRKKAIRRAAHLPTHWQDVMVADEDHSNRLLAVYITQTISSGIRTAAQHDKPCVGVQGRTTKGWVIGLFP